MNIVEVLRQYGTSGINLNKMSSVTTIMGWGYNAQADRNILFEACESYMLLAGLSTQQFAFLSNIQAFLEHAPHYKHYSNSDVSLWDNFLNGKKIYLSSYKFVDDENQETEQLDE
ncbi:hypothetical protein NC516_09125 [Latilactobacillus sakei]|uniref:hypothetical protein n=1 Tax=Latilactobacillus sakei TaxID=1599 RepID=UPI002093F8D5|nr:hypothetical protein [Latilactobacillus sakei]USS38530.1 hypothetical protein NC516_09125 [Latilactobacillus sakei]